MLQLPQDSVMVLLHDIKHEVEMLAVCLLILYLSLSMAILSRKPR